MSNTVRNQLPDASNQLRPGDRPENGDNSQRTSATQAEPPPRHVPEIQDDGITALWTPPDPTQILADIYFVHGLTGHPFKTWHHSSRKFKISKFLKRGSSADIDRFDSAIPLCSRTRGCYWPLDLLPNDFDNVRIFTCGYNAWPTNFIFGGNRMNISQHSQNLLQRIHSTRTACRGRPIIFVGHGLGGILIKDAVLESGKYREQPALKDISDSCTAMFFFGTPHRGTDAARYGVKLGMASEVLGLYINKSILRALQRNGEYLSAIERDFNDLLNDPIPPSEKIQICSFQEGRALTGLRFFPVKKVVDDSSAFFNRRDIEQTFFIDQHHRNMTRFKSASVASYVDFKTAVGEFLRKIDADRHKNADGQLGN
ncbi:hypothetical protein EDD37DRAFT_613048 [Exophiala viscosa]|uniref:uncharacterized protein n=1 Tax=Exophiala viscosa TaxID=2486360 RepID=UPI0021942939|nr:hypothetical protein EDD37DRAFT_613048 [Exophiala viscosa]